MSDSSDSFPLSYQRFSFREILVLFILSAVYLTLSAVFIGLRSDQVTLVLLYNGLYFATRTTRKLILGFSVFVVYWIIFDFMKAFPNYLFSEVHIQSLHDAERWLFGIESAGVRITPNEYWLEHSQTWLDILCGIFYLCWIPVPVFFGAFLFFRNRDQFLKFSFTFLFANFAGFVIYYTYAAAPPWYFQEYGTVFIPKTPGNIAGLARFDSYFGVSVFQSIYSKSSNVFAAMPSLHSAYPLVVLYFGLRNKLGWFNAVLATVTAGIWFAAVYTSHHYVIDVLAGIGCAAVGILVCSLLLRFGILQNWYQRYLTLIS